MGLTNPPNALTNLATGNVINPSDSFMNEGAQFVGKFRQVRTAAYAKVSNQLGREFDLWIPSLMTDKPDRPFEVPGDSVDYKHIYFIGIRVDDELIGTNGDRLKLAENFNSTDAFFLPDAVTNGVLPKSPENAGTLNGYATAQIPAADPLLPKPLGIMPGWKPKLWCVNAAGTALGSGFKVKDPTKEAGYLIVEVCYITGSTWVVSKNSLFNADWQ